MLTSHSAMTPFEASRALDQYYPELELEKDHSVFFSVYFMLILYGMGTLVLALLDKAPA